MHVTLIAHSSVLIETLDCKIWTDPWLSGRVFNESWALSVEPDPEAVKKALEGTTHLWISHEHPDHFHFPTLRSLTDEFKSRVVVLFQKLHTPRMTNVFQKLGFKNIQELRHREFTELSRHTKVYLYQSAPLDSALAVAENDGPVLLNANDVELNQFDLKAIRDDLKAVDTILSQYSFATYDGREDLERYIRWHAQRILDGLVHNNKVLQCRATIPFASQVYFCTKDNAYLNPYRNTIQKVSDECARQDVTLAVLKPGDRYEVGETWDSAEARLWYKQSESEVRSVYETPTVDGPNLIEAANELTRRLLDKYPRWMLRICGQIRFLATDLQEVLVVDFPKSTASLDDKVDDWDVRALSQPIYFALTNSYGMQTLSISGRFLIRSSHRAFMMLRILTALHNAEIFLKVAHLRSPPFRTFVRQNVLRLLQQTWATLRLAGRFSS